MTIIEKRSWSFARLLLFGSAPRLSGPTCAELIGDERAGRPSCVSGSNDRPIRLTVDLPRATLVLTESRRPPSLAAAILGLRTAASVPLVRL